jgi:membrane fusion protein (multidrug efflux system)
VQPRTFADRLQVLGVAKGRESITLTANNAEMIEAVHFRPGDRVRRGQILVELRRGEEEAGILQAQSDVSLAKLNADRWTELANRGVAPRQQAEQFQAAYERAKALLEAAESRRGDRVIRAPFAGVIGLSDIAPGALVSPGTAIATLDDVSVMRVDFDVPDRYLALIKPGGAIVATTDAYPGERYTGRIAILDSRIDERTRSIKARAEFPNPGGRLKPGMLMRVGVDRGTRVAVGAPESAVNFSGGQAYVYKIGTRADGAYAQQTPIIAGTNDCGFIEVREGLEPGDRIILDGLNRIQPNQPVMVVAGPGAGQGRGGRGPSGSAPDGKAVAQKTAGAPQAKAPQGRAPTAVASGAIVPGAGQAGCAPSAAQPAGAPAGEGRRGPAGVIAGRGPAGGGGGRPQAAAQ